MSLIRPEAAAAVSAASGSCASMFSMSTAAEPLPALIKPMLPTICKKPFNHADWIYEPKLDGMRCIAYVHTGAARLLSRNGIEITERYPQIAAQMSQQPTGIYDGEIVCHSPDGTYVSFERLQERWLLRKASEIARADHENPASFYAFDLLGMDAESSLGCVAARKETSSPEQIQNYR